MDTLHNPTASMIGPNNIHFHQDNSVYNEHDTRLSFNEGPDEVERFLLSDYPNNSSSHDIYQSGHNSQQSFNRNSTSDKKPDWIPRQVEGNSFLNKVCENLEPPKEDYLEIIPFRAYSRMREGKPPTAKFPRNNSTVKQVSETRQPRKRAPAQGRVTSKAKRTRLRLRKQFELPSILNEDEKSNSHSCATYVRYNPKLRRTRVEILRDALSVGTNKEVEVKPPPTPAPMRTQVREPRRRQRGEMTEGFTPIRRMRSDSSASSIILRSPMGSEMLDESDMLIPNIRLERLSFNLEARLNATSPTREGSNTPIHNANSTFSDWPTQAESPLPDFGTEQESYVLSSYNVDAAPYLYDEREATAHQSHASIGKTNTTLEQSAYFKTTHQARTQRESNVEPSHRVPLYAVESATPSQFKPIPNDSPVLRVQLTQTTGQRPFESAPAVEPNRIEPQSCIESTETQHISPVPPVTSPTDANHVTTSRPRREWQTVISKTKRRQNASEIKPKDILVVLPDEGPEREAAMEELTTPLESAPPFSCFICGRTGIKRKVDFKSHVQMHVKDKERNFACTTCGKTYLRRSHLNQHILTHTDPGKVLPCAYCKQKFTNEALAKHVAETHRDIPDREPTTLAHTLVQSHKTLIPEEASLPSVPEVLTMPSLPQISSEVLHMLSPPEETSMLTSHEITTFFSPPGDMDIFPASEEDLSMFSPAEQFDFTMFHTNDSSYDYT